MLKVELDLNFGDESLNELGCDFLQTYLFGRIYGSSLIVEG